MNDTTKHDERIGKLTFAAVYPMYVAKVEKKGRTKEELHQVIEWLTGFDDNKIQGLIQEKRNFRTIFPVGYDKPQCAPDHRNNLWLSGRRN